MLTMSEAIDRCLEHAVTANNSMVCESVHVGMALEEPSVGCSRRKRILFIVGIFVVAVIVAATSIAVPLTKSSGHASTNATGDLMAAAGVSYTVGREAENLHNESLAGVRRGDIQPPSEYFSQSEKDHFIVNVDPCITN